MHEKEEISSRLFLITFSTVCVISVICYWFIIG